MTEDGLLASDTTDVLAHVQSGIAVITLNRPERANALSLAMLNALGDLLSRFAKDDGVRAVILTGAGKHFCAGGDVKAMAAGQGIFTAAGGDAAQIEAQQRSQRETVEAIFELPKPTIAVIPGAASGAGLSLALACDVRYAAPEAKVAVGFLKVGLAGDFGFSWLLPHVVGPARAREIALFSDVLDAEQAVRLGLFNAIRPREELLDFALGKAALTVALPADGIAQLKANLGRAIRGGSLVESMDEEARNYVHLRQLPAHRLALEHLRMRS